MAIKCVDSNTLYAMIANGCRNLKLAESKVNNLNVFPVPDGDTGTNMVKTLCGGMNLSADSYNSVGDFMNVFSRSVLLSARGNSGVILSQFIRGWAVALGSETGIDTKDFVRMMKSGTECAYSAVPKPVEGTMLTVLRQCSEQLDNADEFEDFESLIDFVVLRMKESVQKTPELLPVLKQAKVVDSGGVGILCIMEGIKAYLNGEIIEEDSERETAVDYVSPFSFGPDSVLEYGYCTEFVLQLMNSKTNIPAFSINEVISYLETIGDSIVAICDGDIVKVHVHTFTPEKALAFARNYGEFITVKIENMSVGHSEITQETIQKDKIKYAVVTVAMGEGIKDYFAQIGATRIIDGGQTNNPSAKDFLDAFDSVNAQHIVVLPNNSNIYATAKQAAKMYDKCDVRVLETKSIAEGYSAISMMNTWADDIESFVYDMTSAISTMVSVSITKAVHDANLNGIEIKEGHYMAIANGDVVCTHINRNDAVYHLFESLENLDEKAVVTVFYGEDVPENEAQSLIDEIMARYPYLECGMISGAQKIYDYYIAVE